MLRLLILPVLALYLPSVTADSDLEANVLHGIRSSEAALKAHHVDVTSLQEDVMKRLRLTQSHIDKAVEIRTKLDAEAEIWNLQQIESLILQLEEVSAADQQRREMEKNTTELQRLDETIARKKQMAEALFTETVLELIEEEVAETNFDAFVAPSCLTAPEATEYVHKVLSNNITNEIGKQDLLQTPGTKIVYQFTSDSYEPPSSVTIGNLTKLLPEDVRSVLPDHWLQWRVPSLVPDHVWHSVAKSGRAAPPETILQEYTTPGSCWPSSRPIVTIQLAYPSVVTAVSVDHVSKLAATDRSSAPKKLRVIGYAPCAADCRNNLAFTQRTQTFIAEGNYDISSSSSVQTFSVGNSQHEEGSCSTTPQCEAAEIFTSAISVEVTENWGNPHYTCLYRVRVHGEHVYP